MAEARAPRGNEWGGAVDALHGLANSLAVRAHYAEGHPAILRSDEVATIGFSRLLDELPELVLALIDGEIIVCERPMPELRERLGVVIEAMVRHDVECIVFQRGVTQAECTLLARTLATHSTQFRARDAQADLAHVLLRHAELQLQDVDRHVGVETRWFSEDVRMALESTARAAVADQPIETEPLRGLGARIVEACLSRTFVVEQRCLALGDADGPRHAANVAVMATAMALEAHYPKETCVDVAVAAVLHDVGHVLMPAALRGVPEPLLDDASRPVFRGHCFAGARLLLGSGCPPLWVAAALEHHRGVDGKGYPTLSFESAPHELVRLIALANYIDCKRTRLVGHGGCEADEALRLARALVDRFFAASDVHLFRRALGVFPPGTTVELSDRQVAVVTQANANDPFRPQVELVTGPGAQKRVDLKTLDAVDDRHVLSIVRAIAPPLVVREGQVATPTKHEEPAPAPITTAPPIAVARDGVAVAPPALVAEVPPVAVTMPPHMARVSGVYSSHGRNDDDASVPTITTLSERPLTSSAPPRALVRDEAAYREELDRTYLERVGPLDKVPVLKVSTAQLAKLALDHRAGFVLSMIDGSTSIDTIIDMSGIARVDVLRILDELLRSGAIALD